MGENDEVRSTVTPIYRFQRRSGLTDHELVRQLMKTTRIISVMKCNYLSECSTHYNVHDNIKFGRFLFEISHTT